MRTCCHSPTATAGAAGAESAIVPAQRSMLSTRLPRLGVRGFGRAGKWLALPAFALMMLAGCSSVTTRVPAPITDAQILPADPDDEVEPVACLPVPAVLEPESTRHRAATPRPIRRPVRRVRPARVPERETPPPPPPKKPVTPTPMVNVREIPAGQVRGLLDARVQRGSGDMVGRAVDAVANAQGKPRDIVINLTGFMGVGDRKVSLPWSAVRFNPASDKAMVTLVSDAISPTASSPSSGGSPTPAPGGLNLMDASVRSHAGTELGRVIDILLDASGQPRAVVMDVSGSLFHDKHLVAADWSTLHVVGTGASDSGANAMHLETDLTNAQIEASPAYEPGKPPRVVSPAPADGAVGIVAAATAPDGKAVAKSDPTPAATSATKAIAEEASNGSHAKTGSSPAAAGATRKKK